MSNKKKKIERSMFENFKRNVNSQYELDIFCKKYLDNALNKRVTFEMDKLEKNKCFFIGMMLMMMAYTLNCEGYGRKRLPKIMRRFQNNISSFTSGHLSKEDYPLILKEISDKGIFIELEKGEMIILEKEKINENY